MTRPARLGRAHAGAEVVPPGHAGQLVDSYLAEVAARLPCPARARGGIIAELRAGLLDATDAYHDGGLPVGSAAAAAVAEFGDPRRVAGAFRPGLIGLLWAATAVASHIGIRHAPPWQGAGAPPGSLVAFPLAAAACVIAVWAALFTIAATGRATRWLPERARLAPGTAAIAGLGAAAAADLALLVLLASLTRLSLAGRTARRCLAARTALA